MTTPLHDYPFGVAYDGLSTLLGERISRGRDREVWTCGIDPTLVVKVELGTRTRQNYGEWLLYRIILEGVQGAPTQNARKRFEKIHDWLCPVVKFSDYGSYLVMRRTTPAKESDFPRKVPTFLFDLKRANFGMLDGRLVCHDYGIIAECLVNNALCSRRNSPDLQERVAGWWNE